MGDFYFDPVGQNLALTSERIWVEGQLFIGNNSNDRYPNNAKILLTGGRNSDSLLLGPIQDASNKVLAVTGNVTLYGNLVNTIYVRLQAPAQSNALNILVPVNTTWKVGDEIFIAPSQKTYNEYETRQIVAIAGGVITLDKPLQYYHFGASTITKSTSYGNIDMRTEVGLLTRNIVIEGTDEDSWGGRVYVGEIYDPTTSSYYRGRVNFDGVEMKNLGQANNVLAGFTFDVLSTSNNGYSQVSRSVMRDSLGWQLRVIKTIGISFDSNIFYKGVLNQVRFEGQNQHIEFNNNIILGNLDRGLTGGAGSLAIDFASSFYADSNFLNSDISGNIFAGCNTQCVVANGGDCSSGSSQAYTFSNNIAHSGGIGWVATPPNKNCTGIKNFVGYKLDVGIVTYFNSQYVRASNIVITDTKLGVSLNTGGTQEYSYIDLRNSYLAGITSTVTTNLDECSNIVAVYLPVSTIQAKGIPPDSTNLPWPVVAEDHIWQSNFTVSGLIFENFADNILQGCVNNFLFMSNPAASDASASTYLSNVSMSKVDADNIIFFSQPSDPWIGPSNCGGWYCTGISNIILRDLDGSLTGRPASILPMNPTIFDPKTCTVNPQNFAYICNQPGWGLLTFESLDSDTMTRIVSPVTIARDDSWINEINSYKDHDTYLSYSNLRRLSRFNSVVQTGADYKISFTGTPPKILKWGLQGSLPSENITVEFGYSSPQSIRIFDNQGNIIKQTMINANETPYLKPSDPCGTNIYDMGSRRVLLNSQVTGIANFKHK